MEKQIKELVLDYQNLISKLDRKLAVYEQLGSPEEIASKLNLKLESIPESKLTGDIVIKKTSRLLEEKRKKNLLAIEESNKEEIANVIEKLPKNIVSDMRDFLSKFE